MVNIWKQIWGQIKVEKRCVGVKFKSQYYRLQYILNKGNSGTHLHVTSDENITI